MLYSRDLRRNEEVLPFLPRWVQKGMGRETVVDGESKGAIKITRSKTKTSAIMPAMIWSLNDEVCHLPEKYIFIMQLGLPLHIG